MISTGLESVCLIVNQKWIAKNPLILYIEHRGTEARRNKYIEKVKTIEPDFYSVNSVLSKNKALCLCVSVFHSIFSQTNFVLLYKTPEGFLDEMEANIWKEVQGGLSQTYKRKTYRLRIFAASLAVAASITLLLVFSPLSHKGTTDSFYQVEQAFANLSQEDQAYMLAVYQEDLFMNE